jgi:tRNA modification GTPase
VILFLHDLTKQDDVLHTARDRALQAGLPTGRTVIDVWNKADLKQLEQLGSDPHCLRLSAKTGAGLNNLREEILKAAGWQTAPEGLFIARQRHVTALQGVGDHLHLASDHLNVKSPALEVIAEELRLAQNDLNAITGEFTPDDLLGEIFSKFCIGK